jgi:hypothetical protein
MSALVGSGAPLGWVACSSAGSPDVCALAGITGALRCKDLAWV